VNDYSIFVQPASHHPSEAEASEPAEDGKVDEPVEPATYPELFSSTA
jgi:hypothetical protein